LSASAKKKALRGKLPILAIFMAFSCHLSWIAPESVYADGSGAEFPNLATTQVNRSPGLDRPLIMRAAPYAIIVAAGGLFFPLDRDINRQFYIDDLRSHASNQFFQAIGQFGMAGPYLITAPILAAHGLLFKNKKSLYTAGELTLGVLVAGTVTQGFKKAFGRERPYQTDSPFRFFKGGSSFYSGHSISAWTFATIISKNYPRQDLSFIGIHRQLPIIPILTYTTAGLVGVQRLYSHDHWASDVYYGVLAGYGMGTLAVKLGDRMRAGKLRLLMREPGVLQVVYGFN
jgi:membrane-associated phospholipid phosphatase